MHKHSSNLLQVCTAHEAKNINESVCENNSCTAVSTATVVEVHRHNLHNRLEVNKNVPIPVGQCFLSLVPGNKFSLTSCMGIFKASDKEIAKDILLCKKQSLHDFYMSLSISFNKFLVLHSYATLV
jgi:hypothetical protein